MVRWAVLSLMPRRLPLPALPTPAIPHPWVQASAFGRMFRTKRWARGGSFALCAEGLAPLPESAEPPKAKGSSRRQAVPSYSLHAACPHQAAGPRLG
jgi:hypothetical protein